MSAEQFKFYQSFVLAWARDILCERGQMHPCAFVLAKPALIPPYLRKRCKDVRDWSPIKEDGAELEDLVVIIFPLYYEDPKALVECIQFLTPNPELAEVVFSLMLAKAPPEVKDPHASILAAYKRATNAPSETDTFARVNQGKSLVAAYLRKVCREVDALAIVKVDEIWMRQGSEAEMGPLRGKSLEHDPLAKEGLVALMETRELIRSVRVPFTRAEGAVVLGAEEEMIDDFSGTGCRVEGRFIGLLPGYEARRAASPVHSAKEVSS